MALDAFRFWQRIDSLNSDTLKNLCENNNIDYKRVMHNRTDCRIPKADDLLALASGLNTTIEFLLTGEKSTDAYPERIQRIIDKCMSAGETDLEIVERVLRIDSEGEKKSDSGSALA